MRETVDREELGTNVVKTVYYRNKEDALAWKDTDMGRIYFPECRMKGAAYEEDFFKLLQNYFVCCDPDCPGGTKGGLQNFF